MGKLIAFNFVTLNGYFKGPNEDISWHRHGAEENEYSVESLKEGGTLLFGRVTYEMMKSFWPTPAALQNFPEVAEGMNNAKKIVFSKTLKKAGWNNTKILNGNIFEKIKEMKKNDINGFAILGSGSIITQFAEKNLIDEYQIMIDPVALGKGMPIFKNLKHKLDLKLTNTKTFKSGVVLLYYEPLKSKIN